MASQPSGVGSDTSAADLADATGPDATSFARLVAAIRAEIAALDSEDAGRIEAATAAKLTALAGVQAAIDAGAAPDREALMAARDLNSEAALRARGKLMSVEKRLAGLAGLAGRPAPLVYGRDGRWG